MPCLASVRAGATLAFCGVGGALVDMCCWFRYCVFVGVACASLVGLRAPLRLCPAPVVCGRGSFVIEESVFLMVSRVMNVVREFFLGEGVPDWAARGVADQGRRANVAYLEAATVALNSRR